MTSITAAFTVDLRPGEDLPGAAGRFELTKTWTGALEGTSRGTMLTAGDPATGDAGYIASEVFEGTLQGRSGTVALQQLGTMAGGEPALEYVLVPGSGTEALAGTRGTLTIDGIDDDGVHRVSISLV
ncbi:DUF3224 domain-containing protein [Brachybacterium sacelli]|uniref:DUF3224 domain-containing protein n=1 Tax=Brachybacterium sacelli TaxID=173364 RepID=A0ABS4X662_9MICO|nr:DUF3224 domain-containing protein [Brachybacterium sacelli]MBP2383953.1 hypothetical protein [Brachybacterium sacelli]